MDFTIFDKELKQYPIQINKLIFDYYKDSCNICNTSQQYCNACKLYQCNCIKEIYRCNIRECNKLLCCHDGLLITDKPAYLCQRCWEIDIYIDILDDIKNRGNDYY